MENRITYWLACFLWVIGLAWAMAEQAVVVQSGDTLGAMARRHGVTVRAIQERNQLASPDRLSVGQTLIIPPAPGAPVRYVVKSGDTLGAIARRHGVSTSSIATLNDLPDPDALRVGQVILIPAARGGVSASALPAGLHADLDRIRVLPGWTHIVIHHSGTARGNVADMDRYHREHRRMANGLGYHFVIGNGNGMGNGEIAIGPRWTRQLEGGHLASAAQNRYSIGICLVGNFDQTRPTARQMESLRALVQYLQVRCGVPIARVTTHTRINVRPTNCPGRHFPYDDFIRSL